METKHLLTATTTITTTKALAWYTCQPTFASGSSRQEQYSRRLLVIRPATLVVSVDREVLWTDFTPKITGSCCPHSSASDGTLFTTPSSLKALAPLARSNSTEASVRFMSDVASWSSLDVVCYITRGHHRFPYPGKAYYYRGWYNRFYSRIRRSTARQQRMSRPGLLSVGYRVFASPCL